MFIFSLFLVLKININKCLFRIDMGSDVTIVCERLVSRTESKYLVRNFQLKYSIRKFEIEMLVFVAESEDDCILELDPFLGLLSQESRF